MKLLLIDLSSIFWSRWHATAGQDMDAAFRVSYEKVVQLRDGFDACVVCCDVGKSFRHDMFPGYKANRPQRDPAAYDQLRRLRETLADDGYSVVQAEGFEADDVIATLAVAAPARGYFVVIATADKDLCQLVGPAVSVLSDRTGEVRDEGGVLEKFGVGPALVGDYLALVGDKSDNIAGAPGVGDVTARLLLNKLGSLDGIKAALQTEALAKLVTTKQHDSLVANWEQVVLARKLVALRLDAPVSLDDALAKKEPIQKGEPVDEKALANEGGEKLMELSTVKQETPPPRVIESAPEMAIVLDRQDPRWALKLEPSTSQQAYQFAKAIFASQLYKKFPNAEAIFAVILRGRSMGIDMMTALDGFHVIDGKPTASSMLLVACVLSSGKAEYFELTETTNEKATWVTKRVGGRKEISLTFSIEDAQRAGLVRNGGNWTKHPRAMCRKQAGAELARAVYPDVCANVYTPGEFGSDEEDMGRRVA